MKIQLPTNSQLLRIRFRRARLGLLGLKSGKKPFLGLEWGQETRQINHSDGKKVADGKKLGRQLLSYFLLFISIFAVLLAGALFVPECYYRIFPADVKPVESLEAGSTWGGEFASMGEVKTGDAIQETGSSESTAAATMTVNIPQQNKNLPAGQWLVIPRIGVRTKIRATEDPKEALQQGVWLAPDYGRPAYLAETGGEMLPMIMAAHRYGWQWWWRDDYWRYHSFHRLPELEPGDLVEIIADQRKWTYELFAGEEGEEITNYEADLILYTCKFLSSPLRHFRYARLIDLEADTQENTRE